MKAQKLLEKNYVDLIDSVTPEVLDGGGTRKSIAREVAQLQSAHDVPILDLPDNLQRTVPREAEEHVFRITALASAKLLQTVWESAEKQLRSHECGDPRAPDVVLSVVADVNRVIKNAITGAQEKWKICQNHAQSVESGMQASLVKVGGGVSSITKHLAGNSEIGTSVVASFTRAIPVIYYHQYGEVMPWDAFEQAVDLPHFRSFFPRLAGGHPMSMQTILDFIGNKNRVGASHASYAVFQAQTLKLHEREGALRFAVPAILFTELLPAVANTIKNLHRDPGFVSRTRTRHTITGCSLRMVKNEDGSAAFQTFVDRMIENLKRAIKPGYPENLLA
ncbi:hypothetical protein COV82_01330 [Candidatus Peregrinibacteria bacterium CG11_big_fil_rev_8_21_14_0_20_46_8]|nr:MAG: hypothetical protein COV82_01330 [Candidatus Peregrinibacteria bacterium CG11_big_fil_rev_8_21_14_0_20_46_8]